MSMLCPSKRPNMGVMHEIERDMYIAKILGELDGICTALKAEFPSEVITPAGLAQLSFDIQQFQAQHMGIHRKETISMSRIPTKCFRNHSSLLAILREAFKFKKQMHWVSFDFQQQEKYQDNIALLSSIEEALLNSNLLKTPTVYFDPTLSQEIQDELSAIIKKHHANRVEDPSKATYHIKELTIMDRSTPYRILEIAEDQKRARIHWNRFPDSFEEWVDATTLESTRIGSFPTLTATPVVVSAAFLKDLDKYNEWMNPLDYTNIDIQEKKRPLEESKGDDDANVKRVKPNNLLSAKLPLDQAAQDALKTVSEPNGPTQAERKPLVYTDLMTGKPQRPGQALSGEKVTIPSCSVWFRIDSINPIEKRMLPEFFITSPTSVSKTPQVYLQYRNFMVQAYRQDPNTYLNATTCRRHLAGDACAILRVHEFLEHWGLINFQVPPHARPLSAKPVSQHFYTRTLGSGNIYPETLALEEQMQKPVSKTTLSSISSNCFLCSSDCSDVYYELSEEGKQKQIQQTALSANAMPVRPGTFICDVCYRHGKFVSNATSNSSDPSTQLVPSDFIRRESAKLQEIEWTKEETDQLVMLVSGAQGNCDWDVIAASMKNKTRIACITHFLQLSLDQQESTTKTNSHPDVGLDSQNQILPELALFASQVTPSVAAAAAQAAIDEMIRIHQGESKGSCNNTIETAAQAICKTGVEAGIHVEESGKVASSAFTLTEPIEPTESHKQAVLDQTKVATNVAVLATNAKTQEMNKTENIRDLMLQLVEVQVKKMQVKLKQFDLLEQQLEAEQEQLVHERYQLYTERLRKAQRSFGSRRMDTS